MNASGRPAVESGQPPGFVLRVVNPLLVAVLKSPLHRLASKDYMVLVLTGRKTGRIYRIPVGRHQSDGTLTVGAAGTWRRNLRGGATVRIVLDGRDREARAELEEEPDRVAQVYKRLLDQYGIRKARALGLKVNLDRLPTLEELKPAVSGRAIATIRLGTD
jgi:hypothetical protein